MGLDIVAYSHLRFRAAHDLEDDPDVDLEEDDIVHVYKGDFDRLDGLAEGLYEPTTELHVWWHAEHGTHAIPRSEAPPPEPVSRISRAASYWKCRTTVGRERSSHKTTHRS